MFLNGKKTYNINISIRYPLARFISTSTFVTYIFPELRAILIHVAHTDIYQRNRKSFFHTERIMDETDESVAQDLG